MRVIDHRPHGSAHGFLSAFRRLRACIVQHLQLAPVLPVAELTRRHAGLCALRFNDGVVADIDPGVVNLLFVALDKHQRPGFDGLTVVAPFGLPGGVDRDADQLALRPAPVGVQVRRVVHDLLAQLHAGPVDQPAAVGHHAADPLLSVGDRLLSRRGRLLLRRPDYSVCAVDRI